MDCHAKIWGEQQLIFRVTTRGRCELSRWSFDEASRFENADVIFAELDPLDVNEDGYVTALDALIVINLLNRGEAEPEPLLSILSSADTSGDDVVSALDALRIINRLNAVYSSGAVAGAGQVTDVALPQLRDEWITGDDLSWQTESERQLF